MKLYYYFNFIMEVVYGTWVFIYIIYSFCSCKFTFYHTTLCFKKENLKTFVFYFLCAWSIYLAYINFTSFPTNFIASRLISCLFGLLAIVAAIINITNKSKRNLSYLLVSASTLLTLIDMFFI